MQPAPRLLPGFGVPDGAEGIAEAEQFVEDAHEVLVVPGFVLQVPAHEFDHVVEEGFVGVGGIDGEEFEQGQELVLGMALQEVVELLAVSSDRTVWVSTYPVTLRFFAGRVQFQLQLHDPCKR